MSDYDSLKYSGMKFKGLKETIEADLSTTFWMREAIERLNKRDVVDVLAELAILRELFWKKYKESLKKED